MLKSIFSICIMILLQINVILSMQKAIISRDLKAEKDLYSIIAYNNFKLPEPAVYPEGPISSALTNNEHLIVQANTHLHSIVADHNLTLLQPVIQSEYAGENIQSNNDTIKKRKGNPTAQQIGKKKKSKKNNKTRNEPRKEYHIPCPVKGCDKTSFIARNKCNLLSQILMHKYSEKHNPESYKKLTTHYTNNTTQNTLTSKYNLKCTKCEDIFTSTRKRSLLETLRHHLYATNKHNKEEYQETKITVESYLNSANNPN